MECKSNVKTKSSLVFPNYQTTKSGNKICCFQNQNSLTTERVSIATLMTGIKLIVTEINIIVTPYKSNILAYSGWCGLSHFRTKEPNIRLMKRVLLYKGDLFDWVLDEWNQACKYEEKVLKIFTKNFFAIFGFFRLWEFYFKGSKEIFFIDCTSGSVM